MSELKSVRTIREYGRIFLSLREIMNDRGITRNRLAKLIDVRFEVVNRLYEGTLERLDLDVLAKICFVLDCTAGDIVHYCSPE